MKNRYSYTILFFIFLFIGCHSTKINNNNYDFYVNKGNKYLEDYRDEFQEYRREDFQYEKYLEDYLYSSNEDSKRLSQSYEKKSKNILDKAEALSKKAELNYLKAFEIDSNSISSYELFLNLYKEKKDSNNYFLWLNKLINRNNRNFEDLFFAAEYCYKSLNSIYEPRITAKGMYKKYDMRKAFNSNADLKYINEIVKVIEREGEKNFTYLNIEKAIELYLECFEIRKTPEPLLRLSKIYESWSDKVYLKSGYPLTDKVICTPDKDLTKSAQYKKMAEQVAVGKQKADLIRERADKLEDIEAEVTELKQIQKLGFATENDIYKIEHVAEIREQRIKEKNKQDYLTSNFFKYRSSWYPKLNGYDVRIITFEYSELPKKLNGVVFDPNVYYKLTYYPTYMYTENINMDYSKCVDEWLSDNSYLFWMAQGFTEYNHVFLINFDKTKKKKPYEDAEKIFYHYEGDLEYKGTDGYRYLLPTFRAIYPEDY